MDIKQLIAKMDEIESKKILLESTTTVETTKPVETKSVEKTHSTSIYEMLIKEFGYDLNEVENPWAGASPADQDRAAKAAAFAKLSPEDQKWLNGADPTDPYILARAPNKGKPAAGGAAQPANSAQDDVTGVDAAVATQQAASGPSDAEIAANNAALGNWNDTAPAGGAAQPTAPVQVPAGINPETGEKYDSIANAPLQEPPGAEKPAGGAAQPAAPAAPAANKSMTPAITAYAASMGLLKGGKPDVAAIKKFQQDNGLKADGIIGPNTAGAILSAQKPGMAGSGRGGQGGPTAAQLAQAPKPAGGGAQPATGSVKPRYKTPQEFDKEIARFSKTSNPNLPPNARYIATLQAEKAALGGGAAQPASPALPGKAVPGGGQISDTPAAESMLQRIKSLAGL